MQRLWSDNYIADRLAENVPGMLFHRLAAPFGLRIVPAPGFGASALDPGGILLVILGSAGLVMALARWRQRDAMFFLGVVQLANVLFIGAMKTVFNSRLWIAFVS